MRYFWICAYWTLMVPCATLSLLILRPLSAATAYCYERTFPVSETNGER